MKTETLTKEELAKLLNGREYRQEITEDESALAKASGLVVVYGASDDLMEFDGAIHDEVDCWNGGSVLVNEYGLCLRPDKDSMDDDEYDDAYEDYKMGKAIAKKVTAEWCKSKVPSGWHIKTDIPHATFDIMEDGELYCRGVVFALKEIYP